MTVQIEFEGTTRDIEILSKPQNPSAIISYRNVVNPDTYPQASSNAQFPVNIPSGIYANTFVYNLLVNWNEHFKNKIESNLTVLVPDPDCLNPEDIRITIASNGISFTACSRNEQVIITVWGRSPKRILLSATTVVKALRGYGMNRRISPVMLDKDSQLRFVMVMATFVVVS